MYKMYNSKAIQLLINVKTYLNRCDNEVLKYPPESNQLVVELGLRVSNRTTWLSSVPLLTAIQMRGY